MLKESMYRIMKPCEEWNRFNIFNFKIIDFETFWILKNHTSFRTYIVYVTYSDGLCKVLLLNCKRMKVEKGIYSKNPKITIQKNKCTSIFIEALLKTAKIWK